MIVGSHGTGACMGAADVVAADGRWQQELPKSPGGAGGTAVAEVRRSTT